MLQSTMLTKGTMPVPATDQMRGVLDQLAGFGMPPLGSLSPENARQLPTPHDAVVEYIARHTGDYATGIVLPEPEPVGRIAHRVIPGPGGDLLLRIYTPAADTTHRDGDALLPVVVYYHGGGWVIGNLDAYDASCRALCNAAGCVVCSLAYRQAPEHKYPAAAEDAYAAYQWVLANAASLSCDARQVAVAGESAGGNLATVVCLMARDKGTPLPVYQLLIYPVCDASFDTPSYQEHAHAQPLDKEAMIWFFTQYLPSPKRGQEAYASPLRERNLAGLPATSIIAAEIDPLRSEGEAYARRLREAGVPVIYTLFPGVTHEFFGMAAVLPEAKQAIGDAADGLRMGFSGQAQVRMQQAQVALHADAAVASPEATPPTPPANTPPISMPRATPGTANTVQTDLPHSPSA
jgi:acetyl esterase